MATILDGFERVEVDLDHPESPRWHDGAFWFSDYYRGTINRMIPGEPAQVVHSIGEPASALGFMPDGTLVYGAMQSKQLFLLREGKATLHADLRDLPGGWLNDMVVDGDGRTYVGTRTTKVSPTVHHREPSGPDVLLIVEPNGKDIAIVEDICSPNGCSVSPDGKTFTLAEIYARRVLRFDRDAAGRLSNRRVLVEFDKTWPDGISLDQEDAIWFCSPYSGEVVRVLANGKIDQRYDVPGAVACMLGGNDRRTLFVLATDVRRQPRSDPNGAHGSLYTGPGHDEAPKRSPDDPGEVDTSGLFTLRVDIPGAGWPA